MTDDTPSRRELKRTAAKGVRALRNLPGWDPANYQSGSPGPEEQLSKLGDEARRRESYSRADDCEACIGERAESGDETALCEPHLMAAMGL